MPVLLQLERFQRVMPAPSSPTYTAEDVAAAREAGRAEAEELLREDALTVLCRGLADAAELLRQTEAERAAARIEAAQTVAPLIGALLEGVLPTVTALRLQAALLEELGRLAAAAEPVGGLLRCGPDLAPFATACLQRLGLSDLAVQPDAPEGRVELQVQGGTVTFDQGEAAERLRSLVAEFSGE